MNNDVVLYCFAGRKENMILQMPLYRRILEEHPNVHIDIWNLTKLFRDAEYVKMLDEPGRRVHRRIRVRNDYYSIRPWWRRFDFVWQHYTRPEYQGTHFVKIDDDVVFFQPDRFGEFLESSILAPGVISSALTVNNGASIAHIPGMSAAFKKLDMPLLDVHMYGKFAQFAHDFALEHWDKLLHMPINPVPTKDWLSINMIAYDWETGCRVAAPLGQHPPEVIAGRKFRPDAMLGDEGSCNMLPRQIVKGFLAAHLTFGPQVLSKEEWKAYRKQYAEVGRLYLEQH